MFCSYTVLIWNLNIIASDIDIMLLSPSTFKSLRFYPSAGNITQTSCSWLGTAAHLTRMANELFREGLASSTRNTFSAGQQRFRNFYNSQKVSPGASHWSNTSFICGTLSIRYVTIKVYLVAVRQLHVSTGLYAWFNLQLTPQLKQILRGIKKCQAAHQPTRIRLPITIHIMHRIRQALLKEP